MLTIKKLNTIFKNVCAPKKSLREVLKGIHFDGVQAIATNSYSLYSVKCAVPEALKNKTIMRESLERLDNYIFCENQYPDIKPILPDLSDQNYHKVKFTKDYLIDLLKTFDGDILELYIQPNKPIVLQSPEGSEFGLLMPCIK